MLFLQKHYWEWGDIKKLKGQFKQKWRFSHDLLDPVLIKRQFCNPQSTFGASQQYSVAAFRYIV